MDILVRRFLSNLALDAIDLISGGNTATSPPISDPTLNDEQLELALQQRSTATKALLARLTSFHPSESSSDKVEELSENCRTLLNQVSNLLLPPSPHEC